MVAEVMLVGRMFVVVMVEVVRDCLWWWVKGDIGSAGGGLGVVVVVVVVMV